MRFHIILRDDYALAEGKPIRLDDGRVPRAPKIRKRGLRILEHGIRCGRDIVFAHQVFGEYLAAFDFSRLFIGPKAGDAECVEPVHCAKGQRVIRRNDCKIHRLLLCKGRNPVNLLGADGHAYRIRRNAAVSRKRVNGFNIRVFLYRLDDGVLASAAADYHDLQCRYLLIINDGTA